MPRTSGPPEASRRSALSATAASQHGVFTRRQAIAAGYPVRTIAYRLRTHAWEAVDYGVYRTAGTPGSWHQRLLAACLAGPAVASHRAAARLWHAPGVEDAPVEVTAFRHRRRSRRSDVVWHESVRLVPYERRMIDGIPVTEPARTLLDLGALEDDTALVTTFDDFIRRGLTSVEAVEARLEQLGELRLGSSRVKAVIRRRRGDTGAVPESILESKFDQLIRRAGLPPPVRQFEVRDAAGNLVGRADFAYPAHRILIEVQSVRFHGPERHEEEDRRRAALAALDYRIIPIGSRDLREHPDRVVRTIAAAIGVYPLKRSFL